MMAMSSFTEESHGLVPAARGRGVAAYGFPVLAAGAALFLTLFLQHMVAGRPSLFPFFAAILASAWFGGAGPGLFAMLLSLPAGIYFYSGSREGLSFHSTDLMLLVFFASCAMAGGMLSSRQNRADRALALKARELQRANAALVEEMAERQRAEQALQQTRAELGHVTRLTAMGELTASIAHEINQPLAAIANSAAAATRWLNADPPNLLEARQSLSHIVRDGRRAADVVDRVRLMVRKALPEKSHIGVDAAVRDVLVLVGDECARHRVAVDLDLPPGLPRVIGDRIQLQQVFLNLFLNAIEAMADSDRPRRLAVKARREQDGVAVEIADSGGGFAAPAEQLFEPFFTTKPQGLGLGLAICRSLVEAHGGGLSASSGGQGASFHLFLPGEGT
jgi:C4-dicarboxylate-specific signal transduction histidine kinase